MKKSVGIFTELQAVIGRIRELNAEAVANAPLGPPNPDDFAVIRSGAQVAERARQRENANRSDRVARIDAEIRKAADEAAALRRRYAEAIATERWPSASQPVPSPAMTELHDKRGALVERLIELQAERVRQAPAAAGGDKAAQTALDRSRREGEKIWSEVGDIDIAITLLEAREAEERHEFLERQADERFEAATAIGEKLTAAAAKIDGTMRELAAQFGEFERTARSVYKTGAEIDSSRMGSLLTVEARHRAAKSAGLAEPLGISVQIHHASTFEDACRTLVRLAIKRPNPKRESAA